MLPMTSPSITTQQLMQAKGLATRPMEAPLPERHDGESDGDYFRRLMGESQRAREAVVIHATWKRRHLNGLRKLDYMHRMLVVLGELIDSRFLCADYFDTGLPREDCQHAADELEKMGFGELCQHADADWKFALLRQVVCKSDTDRIVVDEEHAGFYITEMSSQLTWGDAEAFFRFIAFARLVYEDIDSMEEQMSQTDADLLDKVKAELSELKAYAHTDYLDRYDEMLVSLFTQGNMMQTLRRVAPRSFKGGYNQKLVCNMVGILCHQEVYHLTPKQADTYIYKGATHYTYINNYSDIGSSNSELTRSEITVIKGIIDKFRRQ